MSLVTGGKALFRLASSICISPSDINTALGGDYVSPQSPASYSGKETSPPRRYSFAAPLSRLYLPVFRVGIRSDSSGGQHLSCLTHIARCSLKILVCMKQVPQKD